MTEYSFNDLKSTEYVDIDSERIKINGITIFDIDQVHFQEINHEFIQIRFLSNDREIANTEINPDEKLLVDENNDFMIIPVDGMQVDDMLI